jgi:hypothetical protein
MIKASLKGGFMMHGWFRVFFAIWLIFFSISQSNPSVLPTLVVLAAIVFVVAIMEVIKKK